MIIGRETNYLPMPLIAFWTLILDISDGLFFGVPTGFSEVAGGAPSSLATTSGAASAEQQGGNSSCLAGVVEGEKSPELRWPWLWPKSPVVGEKNPTAAIDG